MKKRVITISGILIAVAAAALLIGGNYFYGIAVSRGEQGPKLHGGGDSAEAASLLQTEEEQQKIAELMDWTGQQEFEMVELKSFDGLTLKARFLKNPASNRKIVILAHGYRGNSEQMPGITKYYYDLGFDVLKPDARGHGQSGGDYIGYGWHDRKDYADWSQFLVEEKSAKSIYLHGFSMGAATVLMASGEKLPLQVKGIIADSGYTSVKEELTHQLKFLYNLPAFPIMEVTSGITKLRAGYTFGEASAVGAVIMNKLPLFIIHGDKDELVPTEMANSIYDAAKSDKELWIVPGAGHTEAYTIAEDEYKQRLKEFIDRTIVK